MKKLIVLFLPVLLVSILYSCLNDPDNELNESDIYGYVHLYDEFGNMTDNYSMFVTAACADPETSGITDVTGMYIIRNVPFGDCSLVFEKPGFGTYVMDGIKHTADGKPTFISAVPFLSMKSTTTIKVLDREVSGDTIFITVITNPPATAKTNRYIRLFFDDHVSVTDSTYKSCSEQFTAGKVPFTIELKKEYFYNMGYVPGQTVYVKAYGDSFYSNDYFNKDSVKVFPNLNHETPPALSFILP
jgi:hypothetical protein